MAHVEGTATAHVAATNKSAIPALAGLDRFFLAAIVLGTTLLVGLFMFLFLTFAL